MSPVACYNLDTRRPRFVATVALDRAEALIDVLAFDVPDDIARAATVSFVAHAAGLTAGTDIGWRQDRALVESVPAKAGDRLVLAVRQDAVMRAVATFRAQGLSDGDATVEFAFTTIVQTPQGARASPKRSAISRSAAGLLSRMKSRVAWSARTSKWSTRSTPASTSRGSTPASSSRCSSTSQ